MGGVPEAKKVRFGLGSGHMPRVRVRVAWGLRVEFHEVDSDAVVIGRDDEADLRIDHPSIADRHARLLTRRGRLILVDLRNQGKGIRLGQRRIRAPVTVEPTDRFELGEVQVEARITDEAGLVGSEVGGWRVVSEMDSADLDVRRYHVLPGSGEAGHAELAAACALVETAEVERWYGRGREQSAETRKHIPGILGHGQHAGRPYLIEGVAGGVRLSSVTRAVSQSNLRLPAEAAVLILSQVLEAAAAYHAEWGPHGAIEPRLIQLGIDGSLSLLRPGPDPGGFEDPDRRPFLAPERKYGAPVSTAADAWAVGRLEPFLLGGGARPDWPAELHELLGHLCAPTPEPRPRGLSRVAGALRSAANRCGLDPSMAHVARVARLLASRAGRPLGRVRPPS